MKKFLKSALSLICLLPISIGLIACGRQVTEEDLSDNSIESIQTLNNEDSEEEKAEAWINAYEEKVKAEYKEKAEAYMYEEQKINPEQLHDYYDFVSRTYQCMLDDTENHNITYAPISFYTTLFMLSEMTDEKAKMELQNALGYADQENDIIGMQNLVNVLTKSKYYDAEGIYGRLNLDVSFWLQDTIHYHEDVMDRIQKNYSAEIFVGDFKNPEFQKQMTNWVYEKTNHSMQPQFQDLTSSTEQNPFSMISTLDFFGEWSTPFKVEDTEKGIFYGNNDLQVECEFMNCETNYAPYLRGEDYISTSLNFVTGESMIFILPNETQAIYDFGQDNGLTDILSAWEKGDYSFAKMKFSVPKFSCSDKIDLKEIAEKLHINMLFDPSENVFTTFSDTPLFLTGIKQEATISIDEMGCSVAAYTAAHRQSSAAEQTEEIEINLNRPFYYILCKNEVPFLIGLVNNPVK